MNAHEGIRPHKCNHCDMSFTHQPNLYTHLRKVHGVNPTAGKSAAPASSTSAQSSSAGSNDASGNKVNHAMSDEASKSSASQAVGGARRKTRKPSIAQKSASSKPIPPLQPSSSNVRAAKGEDAQNEATSSQVLQATPGSNFQGARVQHQAAATVTFSPVKFCWI